VDEVMDAMKERELTSQIFSLSSFSGNEHTLVRFSCTDKLIGSNLNALEKMGVGEAFGRVEVLTVSTSKPLMVSPYRWKTMRRRRCTSIQDRYTHEMHHSLDVPVSSVSHMYSGCL
jgi:hypothetical protein